jgi:hypothetical protein
MPDSSNEYWIFDVSAGKFYLPGSDISYYGVYSGAPGHQNDSRYENERDIGPIPRGMYQMTKWGPFSNDGKKKDVIFRGWDHYLRAR